MKWRDGTMRDVVRTVFRCAQRNIPLRPNTNSDYHVCENGRRIRVWLPGTRMSE